MIGSSQITKFNPDEEEKQKDEFSVTVYTRHFYFILLVFLLLISLGFFIALWVIENFSFSETMLLLTILCVIGALFTFFYPSLYVSEGLISEKTAVYVVYANWKCCSFKLKLMERRFRFDQLSSVTYFKSKCDYGLLFTLTNRVEFKTKPVYPLNLVKEYCDSIKPYLTNNPADNNTYLIVHEHKLKGR